MSEAVAGGLVNAIRELKKLHRTYEELAERIAKANGVDRPPLERRKLARLGSTESDLRHVLKTPLSLKELAALDVFMRTTGFGDLASVWSDTPTVLEAAAEAEPV